ncbi:MAG: hypothetical protein CSYNP_01607 [Syntrophus sp. SKADARSKE-3]|nr:hypothetical protein [Syntrophus sp. SKADARSKE-3]
MERVHHKPNLKWFYRIIVIYMILMAIGTCRECIAYEPISFPNSHTLDHVTFASDVNAVVEAYQVAMMECNENGDECSEGEKLALNRLADEHLEAIMHKYHFYSAYFTSEDLEDFIQFVNEAYFEYQIALLRDCEKAANELKAKIVSLLAMYKINVGVPELAGH